MKTFFLILLFTLSAYGLYAQQQGDFTYINHRIDSLTQVYSTKEFKSISGTYVRFDNSNLSTEEKRKLIAKIRKLFEQNTYSNLYLLGHRILYDMWWMWPNNNSLEIKQELMELYLQYYFYPGRDQIIQVYILNIGQYYYLNNGTSFSNKARQRIKDILENKKTKEEYEAWLQYNKTIPSYISICTKIAKELMKKRGIQNDTIFQQIRDSVYSKYVYDEVKKDLESLQIKPDLIRMIGLLEMKECIPVLKQNLQECLQNERLEERRKAYRYALARLGDKEQRQYILDHLMHIGNNNHSDEKYFDEKDFFYFKDDEMIWRYIDVNYFSKKEIAIFSDYNISASLKTMSNIYPYIKNLPERLTYPDRRNSEKEEKWAQSLYEWLTANKDTVEFDYEGEKRFPR